MCVGVLQSNMVSPFSVHQQQLAVLAQQQYLLMAAAAKSSGGGGASTSPVNTYPSGSDGAQPQLLSGNLPVQNWPGFQIPGMMIPVGRPDDLQKYMQAECYQSLYCSVDILLISCLILLLSVKQAATIRPAQSLGSPSPFPVSGYALTPYRSLSIAYFDIVDPFFA